LGDVTNLHHTVGEKGISEKRMSPTWLAFSLVLLMRIVDTSSMRVLLVSDGTPQQNQETIDIVMSLLHMLPPSLLLGENDSPNTDCSVSSSAPSSLSTSQTETETAHKEHTVNITHQLLSSLKIESTHLSTSHALHVLAGADVLIGGTSGFSRLAALLSSHTRFVPSLRSHPLEGEGIVVAPPLSAFWDWHNSSTAALEYALKEGNAKSLQNLLRDSIHIHAPNFLSLNTKQ